MADKRLTLQLAKLLAAIAWTDGQVTNSEINFLKDLVFQIRGLSDSDWKEIELYLDHPVEKGEVATLLQEVTNAIRNEEDKTFVLTAINNLVDRDGTATEKELQLLDEIQHQVQERNPDLLDRFSGLIGLRLSGQKSRAAANSLREERLSDFLKNEVYFQLSSKLATGGVKVDLPESEVRKLCLAAGLMAHAAFADRDISLRETEAMKKALQEIWGLAENESALIAEIASSRAVRGLDLFSTARGFYQVSTHDERKKLVAILFQVANADKTSMEEINEIKKIADLLKLDRSDFIDAKLTVPAEDREGM
ncbi:MAG: TerB family tellurite resistance protein [Candidatus Wallbacteria bacterium]|nr:TerB family tellurite resistance protein [Candidatus Wallbacteria bacterium]